MCIELYILLVIKEKFCNTFHKRHPTTTTTTTTITTSRTIASRTTTSRTKTTTTTTIREIEILRDHERQGETHKSPSLP